MLNEFRFLTLLAVLLFWLVPVQGGTLHRGLGPEPDALDIHLAQSLSALNVLRDLHEGLVTLDAAGRLIPGVARAWTVSDDGLVWTFDLDPAARWSDGSAIEAGHFVAGWRRAVHPETAAPMAGLLDAVAGANRVRRGQADSHALAVRAEGPGRLIVELERPTPWFAELLTHPLTFPWSGDQSRLYSGPFVLVERVPGARIRLAANPHFRAAQALGLDEVVWHVIEEPSVELSRYRADQLHITETIPPGRLQWMREQFGEELRIAPYLGTFFLAFNVAREPFVQAPGLRRALSLVIDRELLTERVLGSGEIPAWGLVPPGMPGWTEASRAEPLTMNERIARARELYRQAGYDDRQPLRVELRFNSSLTHRRMAVAVAAMWKQHLGVETRLVNEEWKVFVANRRQGRITQVVRGGWIADWRDAGNFLQLFQSDSPLNYTFFSDPVFDERMANAAQDDGPSRLDWLRSAEDRLLEQAVVIPLYYYVSRHLVKPEVRGFEDNAMDIHLSRWLSLQ
ncbi:peptide ABC transporter substrate-binding protein [Wenzhouxiangella limi]|uniref:Peptide ABC transporter substrate-binding protein n=1 Tax=Wenzhouxiangella limi TaxID=2707351 RepID=A0A845UVJ6_9GAMM|nr:peptide ABC transporter substrate-binding protein [Wenzhouxiangella limi]NDY94242.1 peptide ABC transporter substrate-binding protein [Wenzhouxiangella limi]